MAAKKGLGKGLDSLITDKVSKPVKPKSNHAADAVMIDINKVEPNREQPRKNFDEDALQELAHSIKQFGLLQPILVQDRKDYYEIIAGERRWRAAKKAGIKEERIVLDPGVGFGKNFEQNLSIMKHMDVFSRWGLPVLLGTSRKSVIGLALDLPVDQREEGTAATTVLGRMKGASIFRVHDVKTNYREMKMIEAILEAK